MVEPAEGPARYRIYGRVCASALSLDQLAPRTGGAVDFDFTLEDLGASEPGQWRARERAHAGDHVVATAAQGDDLWYRFFDGTRFRVRRPGHGRSEVAAMPGPDVPDDTIRHFLVDDVLPELLAASGALVLHGAAVVFDAGALVLLGGSGMGKSTLSALLSRRGFPLLADDCVVIDPVVDGYLVQPSSCSVRLWEAGARRVLGREAGGDPVAHFTTKRRYRDGLAFADRAVPLLAVVSLDFPPASQPDRLDIERVAGQAALGLVTLATRPAAGGRVPRSRELVLELIDLCDRVPIARLAAPDDPALVPLVVDALVGWAQDR